MSGGGVGYCPKCNLKLLEWTERGGILRRLPTCPDCGKIHQMIVRAKPKETGVLEAFLQNC